MSGGIKLIKKACFSKNIVVKAGAESGYNHLKNEFIKLYY